MHNYIYISNYQYACKAYICACEHLDINLSNENINQEKKNFLTKAKLQNHIFFKLRDQLNQNVASSKINTQIIYQFKMINSIYV